MRQSEEKYRTLFEESRDAIYITSREGKFVDANQAIVTMVKVYSNTVKAQVEKGQEIETAKAIAYNLVSKKLKPLAKNVSVIPITGGRF
jgi:hypothetical protein